MTEKKKKFKFSFEINTGACMACAACELACNDGAIFIDDAANYGINKESCTRCGRCFRACWPDAIAKIPNPA